MIVQTLCKHRLGWLTGSGRSTHQQVQYFFIHTQNPWQTVTSANPIQVKYMLIPTAKLGQNKIVGLALAFSPEPLPKPSPINRNRPISFKPSLALSSPIASLSSSSKVFNLASISQRERLQSCWFTRISFAVRNLFGF